MEPLQAYTHVEQHVSAAKWEVCDASDLPRSSSECSCLSIEYAGNVCKEVLGSGDIPSQDSLYSDQDALACDELLLSDGPQRSRQAEISSHCTSSLFALPPPSSQASDVAEMIENEMRREAEVRPSSSYLDRHTAPGAGITADIRAVAVSWLVEVVAEFGLQQETLFLGVTYLDRFLSLSQAVPKGMLQLVAVACISLAAKQEEVEQPSAAEWTDISDNCFRKEDLIRMEWLVVDNLGWRGRTPTAYSFLHLYCFGLANCSAQAICMASYLVELALLDYSLLEFPTSTVAASALLVASAAAGSPPLFGPLMALAPSLNPSELRACAARLVQLQRCAASSQSEEAQQCFLPLCEKYARPEWCSVSNYVLPPVLPNMFL